ncbi:TPA: hypothetical protein NKO30_006635 [Pseudomonas aeruginosa]|nr:hypothetical protein [Pseudomonas aeruginosa]
MSLRHLRYPLLHGALGAVFLIRGIKHLLEPMPTLLPATDATPWANGYAVGQSLGISVQLIAGLGLLVLAARALLAKCEKQQPKNAI